MVRTPYERTRLADPQLEHRPCPPHANPNVYFQHIFPQKNGYAAIDSSRRLNRFGRKVLCPKSVRSQQRKAHACLITSASSSYIRHLCPKSGDTVASIISSALYRSASRDLIPIHALSCTLHSFTLLSWDIR